MTNTTNNKILFMFMIVFFLIFSFSALVVPADVAFAESQCSDEESYKCFDDGKKKNYHIDSIPDHEVNKDLDEDGDKKTWKDKIKDALTFKTIKDKLNPMNFIAPALNTVVNLFFKLNMFGTEGLLLITDVAFDNKIVESMINNIQYKVKSMAGTDTVGISKTGTGLFGNMAYPIAVISVVYGIFLLVFRQSILSSFKVMAHTMFTIALAILLFANYSSFMINVNNITTEMSEFILSVGTSNESNLFADSDGNTDENGNELEHTDDSASTTSAHHSMKENLWILMVERPYYYMTFGDTNLDLVTDGDERFKDMATSSPGSDGRLKALLKEAEDYNNQMLLDSNVVTKLGFVPIYQIINAIMSIPFALLMLMMIVYQFWFLIMAILAPFALLIASIPGQIAVLKRYSLELFYPLLAKMGLSFMVLFVFMFSEFVYGLNANILGATGSELLLLNPINYYFMIGIFNIIIFGILFILRKRIKDIFLAGSDTIKDFKEKQGNPFKEPIQNAVKTTATVGGAVIGGVATGGAGAVMGANIGGTLGNVATGQGSVEDVSRTALSTALMQDKAKSEKMDRFNRKSGNELNVPTMNKDELKSVYNKEGTGVKRGIADAGRDLERYEKAQNTPYANLTEDDKNFMKEFESNKDTNRALNEDLDDQKYEDLNDTQKYKVLRDNGVVEREIVAKTKVKTKETIDIEHIGGEELTNGSSQHIPTSGIVSAKEVGMSKVSAMNIDDMSMSDLKEFGNNLESTEFGDSLSESQRKSFRDTIDSGDLDKFKGQQVQDIYGGNS